MKQIKENVTHMTNLANLLKEKEKIESRIDNLISGSIEIRERDSKKYIYIHKRIDGKLVTKYAGEYSKKLFNIITNNNLIVMLLKRQLKQIKKELTKLNYSSSILTNKVKINLDLARRSMVDLIYKQAKLEGVATTYSQTETIINGGKVNNMTVLDITKVINLKHAWEFILSEGVISYPTNYTLLTQINSIVQEGLSYTAGQLRTVPVSIGGTSYLPPLPFESLIKEEIETIIKSNKKEIDKTIDILLYVMKRQMFIDGNKRTAVLFANHFLINQGMGLIAIPEDKLDEFKKLLILYYENKSSDIRLFLKKKCLIKI